jgi:crossover junction endodeoxyribonuclease RusA
VEITFYPPDNRRRDLDGMFSSIKSHLDGIAKATGVDDAGWTFTLSKAEPVKGGAVMLHFKPNNFDLVYVPLRGAVS